MDDRIRGRDAALRTKHQQTIVPRLCPPRSGPAWNIEVTKAAERILTVRGRRDVEVIVVATKIVRGIARTPARELTRSAAPQPQ